jgi:hypothetical protein
MARVTVGPKSGGGWQVTGDNSAFKTQRDAVGAARRQLQGSGGGELVTKNCGGQSPRAEHDRSARSAQVQRLMPRQPASR